MNPIAVLFLSFLKIGAFTFGGGYAMIPLIRDEVMKHSWMSMSELIDFIGIGESTPGPFAVNIATFIGFKKAGIAGSIAATAGVVIPSFIIILIIARFLSDYKDNEYVKGFMSGLSPAVVGSLFSAVLILAGNVFIADGKLTNMTGIAILAVLMVLRAVKKDLHPIMIVALSGLLGLLFGYAF